MNPWLGEPKWKLKEGRAVFIYRFNSEDHPVTPMRLKIEINTREHFSVLGLDKKSYEVKSLWFSQGCEITTYRLEELLGTKLRALYQRKKGRDLFDLVTVLKKFPLLDAQVLVQCFKHYMSFVQQEISKAMFELNLAEKLKDVAFIRDISALLPHQVEAFYDPLKEAQLLNKKIMSCL